MAANGSRRTQCRDSSTWTADDEVIARQYGVAEALYAKVHAAKIVESLIAEGLLPDSEDDMIVLPARNPKHNYDGKSSIRLSRNPPIQQDGVAAIAA